jgi:hypothetical protein
MSTRDTTIRAGWDDYDRTILPPEAGAVQRRETRRAFYAGAIHMFHTLVTNVSATGDDEPTAEDLAMMDRLKAEIDRYAADLGRGRA